MHSNAILMAIPGAVVAFGLALGAAGAQSQTNEGAEVETREPAGLGAPPPIEEPVIKLEEPPEAAEIETQEPAGLSEPPPVEEPVIELEDPPEGVDVETREPAGLGAAPPTEESLSEPE